MNNTLAAINPHVIRKNIGTFVNPYGIPSASATLADAVIKSEGLVATVGVILRDALTKKVLLHFECPTEHDVSNDLIWIPVEHANLEAVPALTRTKQTFDPLKVWKNLRDSINGDKYITLNEKGFTLHVHPSLTKTGVIEKWLPNAGYGFVRRSHGDIYTHQSWLLMPPSQAIPGTEISFVPAISHKGLQARAVRLVGTTEEL